MHRRTHKTALSISVSVVALMALAQGAAAQGAFGGPNNADIRGNAAEEILDRTNDDAVIDELNKQSEKPKLDVDEAEEDLGSSKQTIENSSVLDNLPSEAKLAEAQAKIDAQPNNLDHYFEYAQIATAIGQFEQAAEAYERMLAMAPKLDRVRLDLGVIYMRLGQFEEAKNALQTVLDRNPPPQVQANIETYLTQLNVELATYELGGSITVGMHHDSNGNSAPAEDAIVIFDTRVPLSAEQRAQDDIQFFVAAGLQHSYKPQWAKTDDIWGKWNSSINAYQAEQSSLETLDLKVLSFKTGPEIQWRESGLTLSPSVGYSHISLNGKTYLKNFSTEAAASYNLTNRIQVNAGTKHEWREFENAPGVTTYADRTGSATQANVGARFILDGEHFLNTNITARKERTRRNYFDNKQLGGTVSLTKLLPYDAFLNLQAGYKSTIYDGADALISTKRRHDKERSSGLTLGKKLSDDITATIGYQYRDVNSNIINYKYDNHRFSTALSIRF